VARVVLSLFFGAAPAHRSRPPPQQSEPASDTLNARNTAGELLARYRIDTRRNSDVGLLCYRFYADSDLDMSRAKLDQFHTLEHFLKTNLMIPPKLLNTQVIYEADGVGPLGDDVVQRAMW